MVSEKRKEKNDMQDAVNVAVLGAGYWGRKVVSEYIQLEKTNPEVNLSKVCDLKDENLRFCEKELHMARKILSSDYNDILRSEEIQAIHICTPNETHYKFCMEAIAAGKHVLIEKPMALTARDAWEIVTAAEERQLCLQVGHIFRFNNALKLIRRQISKNYFGDLHYFKMQWTTLMPSPIGRDIIFDLGPHPVDIMNYLLGKWPLSVSCYARAYRRASLEEVAYIAMDFEEKILAHIELSWLQPGKVRELSIMGSKRSAVVDCFSQTVKIYEDNKGGSFSLDVAPNNTIFDEVNHFTNCILGKNNYRNPGAVGAGNIAVLERIKKSVDENKVVKVDSGKKWRGMRSIPC
jgi:UDP-N-acetylglucosamine 3-dehydrogenase